MGLLVGACLLVLAAPAFAQSTIGRKLRTAEIRRDEQGWTIDVNFEVPVRYVRHSPQSSGRNLRIQVEPVNLGGSAEQPVPREMLPLSPATRGPVRQIRYDASTPSAQALELFFDELVHFEVAQGDDFRSIRIRVQSARASRAAKPAPTPTATASTIPDAAGGPLPNVRPDDPAAPLLTEAQRSLRDGDNERAVALLTRILELPAQTVDPAIRMYARELLGLTYERRSQRANARAEYETYLKEFPEGDGAKRVAQRLDALVSAASEPRARLKRVQLDDSSGAPETDVYGMLSSRYYRSDALVSDQGNIPVQSDVFSDANIAGRLETDDWRVRGDFFGSYDHDLGDAGRSDDVLIRALSVEVEDRQRGIDLTVGRQRRSDSGVLGRFDGLRLTSRVGSRFEIAALAGLPVQTLRDTKPNTHKIFGGGSITGRDLGLEGLEAQLYVIGQEADGKTDRVGIGGEFRLARDDSFSVLYLDYDAYFNSLNTALLTSTIPLSSDLNLLVQAERRNTPILTLSNALIGQTVSDLSSLENTYSSSDLKKFAEDRTSVLYSGLTGFTKQMNPRLQIAGDLTVTYLEGTSSSANVPATGSTGPDVAASVQTTLNDWLVEGTSGTLGARYFEGDLARAFGINFASRVPLIGKLRVHPRAVVEWRDSSFEGNRFRVSPSLEFIWQPSTFWVDLEFGLDWTKPIAGGTSPDVLAERVDLTLRWDF
ncbi:MAG: tetratricopeptide repeat protein [Myxococcota bacterium]